MPERGYSRKKQPEAVRRAIINAAQRIAAVRGLADVTIQSVASDAGVTKGGVFHHFANKQELLRAAFDDLLTRIDVEIETHLKTDTGWGSFTRAYVLTLMVGKQFGIGSPADAISMSVLSDPEMSRSWQAWLDGRLERHAATDADPELEIVRFAADGAWVNYAGSDVPKARLKSLTDALIAMTRGAITP